MQLLTSLGVLLAVFLSCSANFVEDVTVKPRKFSVLGVTFDGGMMSFERHDGPTPDPTLVRRKRADTGILNKLNRRSTKSAFNSAPFYLHKETNSTIDPNANSTITQHLDAVLKANATILPQLIVKGTDLDSYFYGPDVANTLRNFKIIEAKGFPSTVLGFEKIIAIISFVESSPNTNNAYLTRVEFKKNTSSPTTWQITAIKKCNDAECSKIADL